MSSSLTIEGFLAISQRPVFLRYLCNRLTVYEKESVISLASGRRDMAHHWHVPVVAYEKPLLPLLLLRSTYTFQIQCWPPGPFLLLEPLIHPPYNQATLTFSCYLLVSPHLYFLIFSCSLADGTGHYQLTSFSLLWSFPDISGYFTSHVHNKGLPLNNGVVMPAVSLLCLLANIWC